MKKYALVPVSDVLFQITLDGRLIGQASKEGDFWIATLNGSDCSSTDVDVNEAFFEITEIHENLGTVNKLTLVPKEVPIH